MSGETALQMPHVLVDNAFLAHLCPRWAGEMDLGKSTRTNSLSLFPSPRVVYRLSFWWRVSKTANVRSYAAHSKLHMNWRVFLGPVVFPLNDIKIIQASHYSEKYGVYGLNISLKPSVGPCQPLFMLTGAHRLYPFMASLYSNNLKTMTTVPCRFAARGCSRSNW